MLIINFDIGKHKRFLYNSLPDAANAKYENKKILQLQQRLFLIEYNFEFESNTQEIEALNKLIVEFKQEGDCLVVLS